MYLVQYNFDRQTDRQNRSVLFCCAETEYTLHIGVFCPCFFHGRDAPFFLLLSTNILPMILLAVIHTKILY